MYEQEELLLLDDHEQLDATDTLSILKRLEKKEDYNQFIKALNDYKISNIDFWEEYKYYFHALSASLGVLSMSVYAYFLLRFIDLPTLQEIAAISRGDLLNYANTTIESMNTTCGNLPITKTICNNSFHPNYTEPCLLASFYYDLSGFLAKFYRDDYPNFPLSNFCDWPKWGDLAYNCAVRVMQYSSIYCLAPNQGHLAGLYVNFEALEEACGTLPNCSTPINTSNVVNSGTLALHICNSITKSIGFFNSTMPGQNYTCAEKFHSLEAYSTCNEVAPCQDYDGTNDWWSGFRIFIVIGATIGLLVWLGTSVFAIVKSTTWFADKKRYNNLPKDLKDNFQPLLSHYDIKPCIVDITELEVTDVVDLIKQVGLRFEQDENLLADRYSTFLLGSKTATLIFQQSCPVM